MKVVIVEDEHLAAQKLKRTLKGILPEIEISGSIPSVEKAVNFFSQNSDVDLIFMDIQLEDGICFEIFEQVKLQTPIIFTTAFDEYTLRAFKENSIDYLLKPIKKDDLNIAIEKYKKLHQTVSVSTLQKVLQEFKSDEYKKRFLVKVGEQYKSVEIEFISCFFVKESYTFLNTLEGRSYGIDYSLDNIESLVDSKDFVRINRNFVIRFEAIENILAYSSNRLKITIKGFAENEDIIVSRERVKAFKEWMDR